MTSQLFKGELTRKTVFDIMQKMMQGILISSFRLIMIVRVCDVSDYVNGSGKLVRARKIVQWPTSTLNNSKTVLNINKADNDSGIYARYAFN